MCAAVKPDCDEPIVQTATTRESSLRSNASCTFSTITYAFSTLRHMASFVPLSPCDQDEWGDETWTPDDGAGDGLLQGTRLKRWKEVRLSPMIPPRCRRCCAAATFPSVPDRARAMVRKGGRPCFRSRLVSRTTARDAMMEGHTASNTSICPAAVLLVFCSLDHHATRPDRPACEFNSIGGLRGEGSRCKQEIPAWWAGKGRPREKEREHTAGFPLLREVIQ